MESAKKRATGPVPERIFSRTPQKWALSELRAYSCVSTRRALAPAARAEPRPRQISRIVALRDNGDDLWPVADASYALRGLHCRRRTGDEKGSRNCLYARSGLAAGLFHVD